MDEVYRITDKYTLEYIQILIQNPREALIKIINYRVLFLGRNTCVSYRDKVYVRSSFFNKGVFV